MYSSINAILSQRYALFKAKEKPTPWGEWTGLIDDAADTLGIALDGQRKHGTQRYARSLADADALEAEVRRKIRDGQRLGAAVNEAIGERRAA